MCGLCLDPDSNKPTVKVHLEDNIENMNMNWVLDVITELLLILLDKIVTRD